MPREILVPIHKIKEIKDDSNSKTGIVAYLENLMSTDITLEKTGNIKTRSNDKDLIEYLEFPLWGDLRNRIVLSNGKLMIRQFKDSDLTPLAKLLVGASNLGSGNKMMEKITERSIVMMMNGVRDHKLELFVVEYEETIIGQVICSAEGENIRLKFVFTNENEEEIEEAAKAVKLIMRRLFGKYDIYKFIFDVEGNQKPLLKELGLDIERYPYELSVNTMCKHLKFYLL